MSIAGLSRKGRRRGLIGRWAALSVKRFCLWLRGTLLALGCPALPLLKSISSPISREAIWAVRFDFLRQAEGAHEDLFAESGSDLYG